MIWEMICEICEMICEPEEMMICEMMICESEELSHLWSGYH